MFLTQATLNGFSFYTLQISHSGLNKKFVEHNFINGTTPFYEVTGVEAETLQFKGCFEDFMGIQRQVFEQLVRKDSVVNFVHPQYGTLMVAVREITTTTSCERVGMVDVDLKLSVTTQKNTTFSLANLISNPLGAVNTVVSQGLGSISSDYMGTVTSSALGPVSSMAAVAFGGISSIVSGSSSSIGGVDGLLNGSTLGRFNQTSTLPVSITNSIDTNQSNGNILSSVSTASSSYFSGITGSITSGISTGQSQITGLFA